MEVGKATGACLKFQKRVAAAIFGISPKRVWLDPTRKNEIAKAKTRDAIRELIISKTIVEKSPQKKWNGITTQEHTKRWKIRLVKDHQNMRKQKQIRDKEVFYMYHGRPEDQLKKE